MALDATNSKPINNIKGENTPSSIKNIIRPAIIPKIRKHLSKKNNTKTSVLNLDNIENYIYTDYFNHIYLYDDISTNSILDVRNTIDEANKSGEKMAPKGIVLHINSPGGDVIAGIGLMRIVARSRVPIIVFVEGLSASAATFISVLAKYRVIAPYASILVHQYAGFNFGQRDLLLHQTNIGEAMFSMIQKLYKKHTKIPHQYLDELLEHDLLLDAKLSVEFGLMDKELHRDISPLVEKYFSINPQYNLASNIIEKKTNFNNIYLYNASEWSEFSASRGLISQITDILKKQPVYSGNNGMNKLIAKGSSKPIVLNIGDLQDETRDIMMILPLINIISLSSVPFISIIDAPISEYCLLITIMCSKRLMYHYAFASINFNLNDMNRKIRSSIFNIEFYANIIMNIFGKYTKLPEKILKTILEKKYILSAEECLKYGIIDEILYD